MDIINLMDGAGEHYAKWNKPGGEGQIPYELDSKGKGKKSKEYMNGITSN